ncbi:hypothetical protein D3C71_1652640 [compost metagenome]
MPEPAPTTSEAFSLSVISPITASMDASSVSTTRLASIVYFNSAIGLDGIPALTAKALIVAVSLSAPTIVMGP